MSARKLGGKAFSSAVAAGMVVLLSGSMALAVPTTAWGAPRTIVHSTSFAGYSASITSTVSTVTGTLSVPTFTCPATGYVDLSSGVFLSGSSSMYAETFVLCDDGTMPQPPLFEVGVYGGMSTYGSNGDLFVSPGDKLSFTMSANGTTDTLTGVIKDKTTGFGASASGPGSLQSVTAPTVNVQAGTTATGDGATPTAVPSFTPGITIGTLKFGTSLLSAFGPTESEMFNGTTLLISTSKIGTGGSFTNGFVHS